MKGIYADYNATTPMLNVIKDYLLNGRLKGPFANPNSLHYQGQKIFQGIEQCREIIGQKLHVDKSRIIFNSGSSESISTTFWMTIGQNILQQGLRKHILCSVLEHAAVIESALYWQKQGAILHWIPALSNGEIDLDYFEQKVKQFSAQISLVAIMDANNETGVIQPSKHISNICQKHGISYLCDTTQTIGKFELAKDLQEGAFLCASSHKLGAPLGSGFLVLPYHDFYQPLIHGGSQERNQRGGTQNYLGIEAMTVALEWHYDHLTDWNVLEKEKKQFELNLKQLVPQARILGEQVQRLPNTSLISFKGIHSQGLQIELEAKNIFVTTSAACSDNEPSTSRVLKSMGIDDDEGRSVIRISTGLEFEKNKYQLIASALKNSFNELSRIKYQ